MARSLVEYGLYGGDEKRAIRILCKHHPDVAPAVCEQTFRSYASAYRDAIAFVAANSGLYRQRWESAAPVAPDDVLAREQAFIEAHPDVPPGIVRTMAFWIFDWHHVR